ncbi:MAG TPA: flagellar basal-body rod protein FlgG [Firmicutes bacterium]|jgi:flagellar basal-body rod protein FlgG|nr:flagellar basal-body rod protein FlgG [Bacillota bacterium]
MMRALWTAGSGMRAQQLNIDVIAHNLANVNTTGFKKSRVEFQDLIYETMRGAGTRQGNASAPVGLQVGHGVRPAATQRLFSPGSLQETGNPLDVAIEGAGFFEVELPDGSTAYTRDGSFKLDADGFLVTSDGYLLVPEVMIPPEAEDISIGPDGMISYLLDGEREEGDQITLVTFSNPAGLEAIGRNLYRDTGSTGMVEVGLVPGENCGTLASGYLELANVQVVEEMVSMIVAQRAYEISAKAIQAADEMLGMANNLRR